MIWALQEELKIDVTRRTLKALKKDAMVTWEEVLENQGLYSESMHNQSDHIYELGRSEVEFFGTTSSSSDDDKLRGPGRDVLYCSEANTMPEEHFRQLSYRTTGMIVLDYNPSHGAGHWIERKILSDPETLLIRSTYEHNPYLSERQIKRIEDDIPVYEEADGTRVKDRDLSYTGDGVLVSGNPEKWTVFGLGQRATSPRLVYPHWQKKRVPEDLKPIAYGLDFGNAVPSALIAVYIEETPEDDNNRVYFDEIIYEKGLTTPDIIDRMEGAGVDKKTPIYADHEQDRIDQIASSGYLIGQANKSVQEGIDQLKQHQICITPSSGNLISEFRSYKRKVVDGEITDDVVKKTDHGSDASRYALHTHMTDPIQKATARFSYY